MSRPKIEKEKSTVDRLRQVSAALDIDFETFDRGSGEWGYFMAYDEPTYFSSSAMEAKARVLSGIAGRSRGVLVFDPLEVMDQENVRLSMENYALSQRVKELEKRMENLEEQLTEEEIVVLREISRDEAKSEIAQLFSKGETLYYSDIAKRLRIDLELIVDICQELLEEGEITVADDAGNS